LKASAQFKEKNFLRKQRQTLDPGESRDPVTLISKIAHESLVLHIEKNAADDTHAIGRHCHHLRRDSARARWAGIWVFAGMTVEILWSPEQLPSSRRKPGSSVFSCPPVEALIK